MLFPLSLSSRFHCKEQRPVKVTLPVALLLCRVGKARYTHLGLRFTFCFNISRVSRIHVQNILSHKGDISSIFGFLITINNLRNNAIFLPLLTLIKSNTQPRYPTPSLYFLSI